MYSGDVLLALPVVVCCEPIFILQDSFGKRKYSGRNSGSWAVPANDIRDPTALGRGGCHLNPKSAYPACVLHPNVFGHATCGFRAGTLSSFLCTGYAVPESRIGSSVRSDRHAAFTPEKLHFLRSLPHTDHTSTTTLQRAEPMARITELASLLNQSTADDFEHSKVNSCNTTIRLKR